MTFLKREKKSWGSGQDEITLNKESEVLTEERKKMLEEENKLAARRKKMDHVLGEA
jgi:hypothetical protein